MPPNRFKSRTGRFWIILILFVMSSGIICASRLWKFLSVPVQRVDANVLVVEGWVYDFCLPAAVAEFNQGHYSFLATSGISSASPEPDGKIDSPAASAARKLIALGIDPAKIIVCPAPATIVNRTSSSARAVKEQLSSLQISCTGINLLTTEPHSRQSWLAYKRIFDGVTPIGIVPVVNKNLTTGNWWKTPFGWLVVAKDFSGWFKEYLFGYRH